MRKISLAACILLFLVSSMAHAAVSYIGSCNSKLGVTGESKTGSGTISVAVIVPSMQYQGMNGASITAIRIGLITVDGISNVKAWIRNELTGENIAEAPISSPKVGWNEVNLAQSLILDANAPLVLG